MTPAGTEKHTPKGDVSDPEARRTGPGGGELSIAPLDAAQLATVEPLWRSLIDHLRELDSVVELVPHEQSWPRRLAIYEELLADGESFALGARRDDRLVGYAVVHVAPPDAVWSTGARYAELTSLCVAVEERGGGLGTALLDAAESRLTAQGIDQYVIGVDTVNKGAQRFYEKRGFRDGFHLMHGWIGDRAASGSAATGASGALGAPGIPGATATTGASATSGATAAPRAADTAGDAPDSPESIMRGID